MASTLRFALSAFVMCGAFSVAACSSDDDDAAAPASTADTGTPVDSGSTGDTATAKDLLETAAAAGTFKTLIDAVTAAELTATLKGPGPFTVFAPTDDAFKKLPAATLATLLEPANKAQLQAILKYHVLSGSAKAADVTKLVAAKPLFGKDFLITVDGAKVQLTDGSGNKINVTATDIVASNGVIHVIDAVLLPPAPTKDIVDTAVGAGSFGKLAEALTKAELIDTLKGAGPFTVFAPTDAAFAKLPAGTLDTLLKPENKAQLQAILKYHVVAGDLQASDVTKASSAKTVEGKDVSIKTETTGVTLTDAKGGSSKVTAVNVQATNGVIHVIDTVLLPN